MRLMLVIVYNGATLERIAALILPVVHGYIVPMTQRVSSFFSQRVFRIGPMAQLRLLLFEIRLSSSSTFGR